MGNRATVIFENAGGRDEPSPAVYLHWNGGPESVYGYLEEMGRRGWYRSDYAAARFAQIVGEHFSNEGDGDGLSLGVFNGPAAITAAALEEVDTDHGDNGFYVVRIKPEDEAHGLVPAKRATFTFHVRRFTETETSAPCEACKGTGALALETGKRKLRKVGTCTRCNGSGKTYTFPLVEWSAERVEAERAEAERHEYRPAFRKMYDKLREFRKANAEARSEA